MTRFFVQADGRLEECRDLGDAFRAGPTEVWFGRAFAVGVGLFVVYAPAQVLPEDLGRALQNRLDSE